MEELILFPKDIGEISPTGLTLRDGLSFAQWHDVGSRLQQVEKSVLWWVGDWLNYGERRYGEKYTQALEETGFSLQTLKNAKWISSRIELSRRRDVLSFNIHAEVAVLPTDQQVEILEKAEKGMLQRREVRRLVRTTKHRNAAKSVAGLPDEIATLTSDQSIVACDALITDPPYGILSETWEPGNLEEFTRSWALKWNDCGAKCMLIFWSQRHLWGGRAWFDESLGNYEFQQLLVWHYANNKKPQSRKGFKQTWEPIFFYRAKNSDFKVGVSDIEWGEGLNSLDCHVAAVPQSNFNDAECKVHPAQKPVSVFRWLINAVCKPGDLDLIGDPFMGSGTCGIAALQLGMRFHGIESDEEYLRAAKERIATYGIQQP